MSEGWTSLAVQWLRFCASIEVSMGSIPGQGNNIPHAMWPKKKKKSNNIKAPGKKKNGTR